MIAKLGFRNILRNKRRSVITCSIMGFGLAALIFADAFLMGLNKNMIESVTSSFMGDGQIHRENFLRTREIEKTINNSDALINELANHPRIEFFTKRVVGSGMLASPTDVVPVAIIGINPLDENKLSNLGQTIIKGAFLDNEVQDQIIVGEKLARFLGVDIGDKVVLTTAQAHSGNLNQELFRISGIFKMKNKDIDSSAIYLNTSKAQSLMNLNNEFHEIVFKFKNKSDVLNPPKDVLNFFSKNENIAESWKTLMPAIDAGLSLTAYSLYIGSFILFAIIALSTMNTLFMSLFERMYEFGVMKAIGTRPWFIFKLIVMEAVSLAIISIIAGVTLGALVTIITNQIGINHLTDVEYLGTTIKSSIRPEFALHQYVIYPLSIIIFALISSIYPAFNASKLNPSKAMKRD